HRVVIAAIITFSLCGFRAQAGDLRINIPRHSSLTPVQKLNRDGVEEVRKHKYGKAEAFFYRAYLLDPDDPFTLNNLGYVSELQGQVDRAERFYALAAQQPTDAMIDIASSDRAGSSRKDPSRLRGRSFADALAISNQPLQVNHDNVEAVRLLSEARAPEADVLLQQTLKNDPHNVFTLNNIGVAKEMEGESDAALKYYDEAAAASSEATAMVTLSRSWRGKPVHEMAAQNARKLRRRLETEQSDEVKLAELNLRGVSAINRNDLSAAFQDFRSAYALDPNNAFALNNIGYLAEIQGDPETAQFFYDKAKTVIGADTLVGLATRRSAQGMKLFQVASDSDSKVEAKMDHERQALRSQHEPIVLRRRDDSLVDEAVPAVPQEPPPSQENSPQ
ncbi:MAG: tetratricopeptide repeat protein, partial [Terriglobales bacterium]